MRKLVFLIAAVVALVGAAAAYAVADTVTYSASITPNKAGARPVNVTYNGVLSLRGPGGTQPDGAGTSDFFYAKQLVNNGKKFPSPCKQSDIDGKTTIPAKCNKALIGTGTAKSSAGAPGAPISAATTENLTVKVFNANKGKGVFLVLNGTTPLPVVNRVIPGTITKLSGQFSAKVTFKVPANLQTVPGSAIPAVLTDSSLSIGKVRNGVGYLQLTSCPSSKKLQSKVVIHFNNGTTGTKTSTIACRR